MTQATMLLHATDETHTPEPPKDCPLCPRLVGYRNDNKAAHPDWFNGAVPSFGRDDARLLIVGLAPGLKGANRTGRPFLGDYAGELLYGTLLKVGLARGQHDLVAPEALELVDCMISNAVRCVPPANKPLPEETATCRRFLIGRIQALPNLRSLLALGRIAHGARHELPSGLLLFDSYHCSRQNTSTRRLTAAMFEAVLADAAASLQRP
jgi:uracil-DNA glycosylase